MVEHRAVVNLLDPTIEEEHRNKLHKILKEALDLLRSLQQLQHSPVDHTIEGEELKERRRQEQDWQAEIDDLAYTLFVALTGKELGSFDD